MRNVIAFLALTTLCACTPDAPPTQVTPKTAAAIPLQSPPPFDSAVLRLPSKYVANPPGVFFPRYMEALDSIQKGEFETSDAYAKRIADIDALIKPFSTQALYAFSIRDPLPEYDADAQTFRTSIPPHCFPKLDLNDRVVAHLCEIGSFRESGSDTLQKYLLAVDRSNAIKAGFETVNGNFLEMPTDCRVPAEKARAAKSNGIRYVLVGSLQKPEYWLEDISHARDEPGGAAEGVRYVKQYAFPFKVGRVLCYDWVTGEILDNSRAR